MNPHSLVPVRPLPFALCPARCVASCTTTTTTPNCPTLCSSHSIRILCSPPSRFNGPFPLTSCHASINPNENSGSNWPMSELHNLPP
ncbi:hypothetical protein BKA69DRAFT_1078523 [Paraphysoderma sedebokerense]|nr:hypothetical protein BKA69DRAFT_1078523 [Paraphysoderma sedebokerense]